MQALQFLQVPMNNMHSGLRRLDLNLLLVFEALYRHASVSAAADELAMSPSAFSHALSRLRNTLSDPLFVRVGNAMRPTSQATRMAGRLREALQMLSDELSVLDPFDPATSTRKFNFGATDYTAYALLPPLMKRLQEVASNIRIEVIYATRGDALLALKDGRLQFVLGVSHDPAAAQEGLDAIDCFVDDYVVIARAGHPRVGKLSLPRYLAEHHIAVLPWMDTSSVVDQALAKLQLRREIVLQLPSLMAAPFIVAETDYLATLPRRVALEMAPLAGLQVHEAPFEIPRYSLRLFFQTRQKNAPELRWMGEQLRLAMPGKASA